MVEEISTVLRSSYQKGEETVGRFLLALKVVFGAIKNENLYSDEDMCYNYLWNFLVNMKIYMGF